MTRRQRRRTLRIGWLVVLTTVISVGGILATARLGAAPVGQQCPLSHGYWKTHPEAWPVHALVLGNPSNPSHTYVQTDLLTLLGATTRDDASVTLAHQLIAAKLNIANGSNAVPIAATLSSADTLLAAFPGTLPYVVKSNSSTGTAMIAAATILDDYNNGRIPDSCGQRTNTPPVANAGPDQSVFVGDTVQLDGSKSSDVDGDPLTFYWSFVSRPLGSLATLSDPTAVRPTFLVDVHGSYTLQLIVNDGVVDSVPDTVIISTLNSRPVADAGPDQTVALGARVTLDGRRSRDVDGDPLTYHWRFVTLPAGSAAVLDDPSSAQPSFTADKAGSYAVELIVNDGTVDSNPDQVIVTTENSRPVANAGPDQLANVGDTVQLDGSGSSDADGDPLTYKWSFTSKPQGSATTLSNATLVNPTFVPDLPGLYVAQLIVSDGHVDSLPDTASITVQVTPPLNRPPVAVDDAALIAQNSGGLTLTVLANDSDPDGDPLSITGVTQPANGTVTNTGTTVTYTPNAGFHGVDAFTYTISDGRGGSATATVRMTVDQPPLVNAGADQTITLPASATLAGTVTDDGLPAPPGAVSSAWSTVSGPGTVTFGDVSAPQTSASFSAAGDYTLRLTANDGFLAGSSDVHITVKAAATNHAPVAADDSALAGQDTAVQIGVLANDSDPDGDPIAISGVAQPAHGQVTNDATTATYTPNPGFHGVDTFTYTITDGRGASATATVTVTVNGRPLVDAGPDQALTFPTPATLHGTVTDDGVLKPVTTTWSAVSGPGTVTFGDASALDTTATFSQPGTYTLRLTASDALLTASDDLVVRTSAVNQPPVADAGPDKTASVGTTAAVNGSASSDPDGDPLTFTWSFISKPAGSAATLSDPSAVAPTFAVDVPGTYELQLIVNDGHVDSTPDTVTVSTNNSAPVANAGPDQAMSVVSALVQLDGSGSTDVDGNALTFTWSLIVRPDGSAATLSDPTAVKPTFVFDQPGTYVAQLIVNDGTVDSAPDTVTITPDNLPPVANAGPAQTVAVTATAHLDGSASTDPNGDPLTFLWSIVSKPSGSTASLSDAAVANPTFVVDTAGTYVAQLIVNDGVLNSAPSTVTISTENSAPIASAGPAQLVAPSSTVFLNGSGSFDPDGTPLNFSWSFTTKPAGSTATLSSPAVANPTFFADVAGVYVAQLIVDDGVLTSAPATVTVTAVDLQSQADLSISFFNPATNPPVGSNVSFVVLVDNHGPASTSGVTARFKIPAGYTLKGGGPQVGTYDSATGNWTIGLLSSSGGAGLFLTGTVNAAGPYNLAAAITGSSAPDPNLANNTATATVTPNANADLSISFFNPPSGTLAVGSNVSFVVLVDNHGPASTSGVTARFQIPAGYTLKGGGPQVGTYDSATGNWTIGPLSSSGGAALFLTGTVNATGPLGLSATITGSSAPDPDLTNNIATPTPANRPPIANAGAHQTVGVGSTVVLDGSLSNDPDGGDSLTYQWTFFSQPANSAAVLSGANTVSPSFVTDVPGTFTVQLQVTDTHGATSAPSSVTITANVLNHPPTITSAPVTVGAVGQPYSYAVHASDPDAGDTLGFSLPSAPVGMTIDPTTGLIQWTPTNAQGGQQPVTVRVQDAGGLFATQDFAVQVSAAANQAPVAVDDAYEVRPTESLSVPAPGVLRNDGDLNGNALTARLVTLPTNGTLDFNSDGSFTYTPHTLLNGEFVGIENLNLATRVPGVTFNTDSLNPFNDSNGHTLAPSAAFDDDVNTGWRSSFAGTLFNTHAFVEIVFPQGVTVTQLQLFGTRDPQASPILTGTFQLFDGDGIVLFNSGPVDLPAPTHDTTVNIPNVAGVRRVRFTHVLDAGLCCAVGVAELKVIGSTLVQRQNVVPDNNLAQLLPVQVNASGSFGSNIAENVVDDSTYTNWYADSAGPPFIELVFPVDVTATQLQTVSASARPDGFLSTNPLSCEGVFQFFDANDVVLFDTGVVQAPCCFLGSVFTLSLPNVSSVRRVRYTNTACPGSTFQPGFAEFRVFGPSPVTTPAFSLARKFHALIGRTVHATPMVANLTDDNGDGKIDQHDIPDIVVPVESLGSKLTGEIKVISGDDGRELFTLGGPDLVSPWAEIAIGDLDGDGIPEVVAVHSNGNNLIAFDFGGGVVQGDLTLQVRPLTLNTSSSYGNTPPNNGVDGNLSTIWSTVGGDLPSQGSNSFYEIVFPQDATVTQVQLVGTRDSSEGPGSAFKIVAGIFQLFAADGTVLFDSGVVSFLAPDFDFTLSIPSVAGVRRVRLTATADQFSSGRPSVGLSELKVIGSATVAAGVPKVKWLSDPNPMPSFNLGGGVPVGAVSIANLDGGPRPHIIVGASVFDSNGKLLGDGRDLGGTTGGIGLRSAMSVVADLDLDGIPALIAGPTAYRLVNGQLTKVWQRADRPDGYVGVGNFDDDPNPEIVVVADGFIYMLNHDGTDAEVWNPPTHAPLPLPGGTLGGAPPASGQAGAPLIVDVDGDGIPEIGVATATGFVLSNRDGTVRWRIGTTDTSSHTTSAVAFDFDGSGTIAIVYRDEQFLRVIRGVDGVLLAKTPVTSQTWAEQPVVVDVDNDGHADIVVASDNFQEGGRDLTNTGILVFQDSANKWTRTRRIWNQHAYHITNVNEDGSIPQRETPNWLVPGLNNFRTNAFIPGETPDQADSFTYKATDGILESNEATVRITLRTPNSAPRITSTPPTAAAVGLRYVYGVQATDPDPGDVLTFSLPTAPAGMTVDVNTGVIQWTPTNGQLGSQNVVVKVHDVHGAFALQSYAVQVATPTAVPNVVGQPQATAQATISGANFKLGVVTSQPSATVPAGLVMSQSPAGGSLAAPGSNVSIVVASGPPPPGLVPNLVGQVQSNAQADILAAGFVVGAVTNQNSLIVPQGVVISQAPAAGTAGAAGAPVSIVVSLGPAHIPNVVGQQQSTAAANLAAAGFVVGATIDQTSSVAPKGVVLSQDPAAGTAAATGSAVNLLVSLGPGVPGDTTPPAVGINLPDGAVITIPTDIIGTATDANFIRYTLDIARVDSDQFTRLGSGTAPSVDAALGRVDPTLLENGLYRLRLTAEDANGQISVDERVIRIDGLAKVGNFRLSFTDLSIPLAGMPITIVRTYDSRVKTGEDFGVGWTLDVKRGFYQHNRTPGEAWQILSSGGFPIFPCRTVSETAEHLTEVRLSDFESYRFALTLSNLAAISGGCTATATFSFVDGRRPGATLEILDGTDVFFFNGDSQVVYPDTLLVYNPSKVRLTTADGRIFDLERGAGITRIQDLDANTLNITPAGIEHSSGRSVAFSRDAQGRITRIVDPRGNALNYAYDANGDLTTFIDQANNQTAFTYDVRHNLLEIRDPLGRRPIRAEYDADGRLVGVTDANGNQTTFSHDLDARQELITDRLENTRVVEYDPRGNVVRRTDPLGNVTTMTYDGRDNRLSETDPLGKTRTYAYDASDNLLTETNPLGNTITHTYDSRNQELTRTDALGATITRAYDGHGRLLTETDPLGATTTYTYDGSGNPLTLTDPLNNTWTFAYDAFGHQAVVTDPLGNTTTRAFDANGRLIDETTTRLVNEIPREVTRSYQYDARNQLVGMTDPEGGVTELAYTSTGALERKADPLGRVTRYVYDDQDRPIATTYPDGTSRALGYDLEGRLTALTDRAGRATSFVYDSAGRHVSTTYPDGASTVVRYDAASRRVADVDANGGVTGYGYDAAGRNTSIVDPRGGATTFVFDAGDKRVARVDRNGGTTTFTYDLGKRLTRATFADGSVIAMTYDALGRRLTTTDQAGNVTGYAYDTRGNLTEVLDALNGRTRYTYDAVQQRIGETDPLGNTTRFTYDGLGRRLTRTLPLGQVETRSYDAAGNLSRVVDFNGQTILYVYDAMNNLIRRMLPDGTTDAFTYTSSGRLASMTDSLGSTTFTYDLRDRPMLVRAPDGTEIGYAYDAKGNRTSVSTPAGTTRYAYDAANRLIAVDDPQDNHTTISYDAHGNLTGVEYPNGVSGSYAYDILNRLIGITQAKNGATIRSYAYTLGPAGNRLRVAEENGRQVDYSYDALFRLTQERITPTGNGAPLTISYIYDGFGNRLTKTIGGVTTGYTYDANGRLTSAGAATFSYDAKGNLLGQDSGGITTTYQYDALNRLRQLNSPSGSVTTFVYDPLGNRVGTTGIGGSTHFLVDPFGHGGTRLAIETTDCCDDNRVSARIPAAVQAPARTGLPQVLRETDDFGGARADYVYGGRLLISQLRTGATSFYLPDGQRSTRALMDTAGTITDTYDYDAFGQLLERNGTTTNSYLYTGEQLDPGLAFYYLRARYYDPSQGRFTARDPFLGRIQNPASLQPYMYAAANPVNRRDPTGRESLIETEAAAAIADNLDTLAEAVTPLAETAVSRTAGSVASLGVENLAADLTAEGASIATDTATEEAALQSGEMTVEANELEVFAARNTSIINTTFTNLAKFFSAPANANTAAVARVLSIARGARTYGLVLCVLGRGTALVGGLAKFSNDPLFDVSVANAMLEELRFIGFVCPGDQPP